MTTSASIRENFIEVRSYKMTILGGENMENNYPNPMCFGNEPYKCNRQNSCPDYKDCKERYYEVWFSFMEEN